MPSRSQRLSVRSVKLTIAFVGTAYEGWQSQLKGTTVQEIIESRLKRILKERITVHGSSRTDSGVHAESLVAHFKTRSRMPAGTILRALNFHLPKDIAIRSAVVAKPGFHARFDAKSKVYEYRIWNGPIRPVFQANHLLWVSQPLSVTLMRQAARILVGTHDFTSFWDKGKSTDDKNAVRSIKRILIQRTGNLIRIRIEGDGFLRHMVRVIVGTLLDVGRKRTKPAELRRILAERARKFAGATAPAHGLTLLRVKY